MVIRTTTEYLLDRVDELEKVKSAARKLVQCFPKRIKGKKQKFDIPRYIIDELEEVLKYNKKRVNS